MIRIPTYKEHPQGNKIYSYYAYLMALVLPFPPEDIWEDSVLVVDEKKITCQDFIDISKKKPRKRNDGYKKLLNDYHVTRGNETRKKRFEEDQLLAAKIIKKASIPLYEFLYKKTWKKKDVPELNDGKLRELLFSKMDAVCPELRAISPIAEDHAKILLEEVFRYESFAGRPMTALLMREMDVHVCPYCNRQYTVTASGENGTIRPQFDHYKSKIRYPYFAVSLYNLIPCCGFCNQKKADTEKEVLYPYSDEMGTDMVFRTKRKSGFQYLLGEENSINEFDIELVQANKFIPSEKQKKIKNSNNIFCLTELYNEHKDYVLSLFQKRYVYNTAYLEFLFTQFPDKFQNMDDVKRMAYLMDVNLTQWGRRPLSKLTHDIDCEIEELLDDSQ